MRVTLQYNTDYLTTDSPEVTLPYLGLVTVGIRFVPDNSLPSGAAITLALKEQGDFDDSTSVLLIDGFAMNPQTGLWETEVEVTSADLTTLFDLNPPSVTLYSSLLVLDGTDHWFQGPTQVFLIQNPYTQGGET